MLTALKSAALAAVFLGLVFTGCSGPTAGSDESAAVKKRSFRLVSFYNTATPVFGEQIVWLANSITAMSGGSLKVKVFDPDKLVGPREVLDAVASGKVEAGYASSGFWMGKMPAAPLFSAVPFGPTDSEYLSWFYHGNGMKLYQEMYDRAGMNVRVFICGLTPPDTSGWFSEPIEDVADLNGLKMRFFGLGGETMKKFGVSVRLLPPGEIFPALEKGVIDATEMSLPSIDEQLGLHKVAKHNYFPGWHQQVTTYELLINKDAWESLAPSQQAIIETATRANVLRSLAVSDGTQGAAIARNVERGVKQEIWSDEMLDAFRNAWLEVVAERCEQDPFFKTVWEDLSDFREKYRPWGSRAYLANQ